jgi:hypothetical protein
MGHLGGALRCGRQAFGQTVGNQIKELRQIVARWEVVVVYTDAGISGAKGLVPQPRQKTSNHVLGSSAARIVGDHRHVPTKGMARGPRQGSSAFVRRFRRRSFCLTISKCAARYLRAAIRDGSGFFARFAAAHAR